MTLYFAYGSNLDQFQMLQRCPGSRFVSRAWLHRHALTFAGFSARWGGAVATAVQSKRRTLLGALYTLTDEDIERLDRFEGCPHVYRRMKKLVSDESGKRRFAYLYVQEAPPVEHARPSKTYVTTITTAYRDLGFDDGIVRLAAAGVS